MSERRLAEYEPGVIGGQCCSCGAYDEAEWTVTIVQDRSPDMRGVFRLCEPCYRDTIAGLMTPARAGAPLRGYA